MKNLTFLFLVLLFGCSNKNDSNLISDPKTEIFLNVQKTNSENDYSTSVRSVYYIDKSSGWINGVDTSGQLTDNVSVSISKRYGLILENSDTIEMKIILRKIESKELLVLKDTTLPGTGITWDYKNFEDKKSLFYEDFDEAVIDLGANGLDFSKPNENFKTVNVLKASEQGIEKSYVEINFAGIAYGWYDPSGEHMPVYTLKDGEFRGILE